MNIVFFRRWRFDPPHLPLQPPQPGGQEVILSFDVEEHHRIEAAAHLVLPEALKAHYDARLEPATTWLLDQLDEFGIRATFFVVGQIARSQPGLVRKIVERGHEVGSHSWDHRRIHHHTPASFREDLRLSRDALEQVAGQPVLGYRAPTFSVVAQNAWALDELAQAGFVYDSSIFPVRHDRYGVPRAPRRRFGPAASTTTSWNSQSRHFAFGAGTCPSAAAAISGFSRSPCCARDCARFAIVPPMWPCCTSIPGSLTRTSNVCP